MTPQRRHFSADFKAHVPLEAIREQKTINELASESGVYPNLIRKWKKYLLEESLDTLIFGCIVVLTMRSISWNPSIS
jgi:transposase-like protein